MKKKLFYLISGVLVYFSIGICIDYLTDFSLNWNFVLFWTVFMTLTDFFIFRSLKKWILKKQRNQHV